MATKKNNPTNIFRDYMQAAFPDAEVIAVNGLWPKDPCRWQVTLDDIPEHPEHVMDAAREKSAHHIAEHKTTFLLVSIRDGRVIVRGAE